MTVVGWDSGFIFKLDLLLSSFTAGNRELFLRLAANEESIGFLVGVVNRFSFSYWLAQSWD
jgi:hypothetical protein